MFDRGVVGMFFNGGRGGGESDIGFGPKETGGWRLTESY